MNRPRTCTRDELAKVNVVLVDVSFALQCQICGLRWSPNIKMGARRLPNHYWKCPNGCNTEDGPRSVSIGSRNRT